jgi:hypothetical protein
MSDTFNTWPPDIYALNSHERDKNGRRVLPRILHRKPRAGDIHPLKPAMLQHCLQCVPPAYVYGLKAIELSPRRGEVGAPYGIYRPGEKRIRLYSCPKRSWHFSSRVWPRHEGLLSQGARIAAEQEDTAASVLVEWHDPEDLEMFFIHVLFHELGHHYVEQYRSSRGQPKTRKRHEIVADLHDLKISTHLRRRISKKPAGT